MNKRTTTAVEDADAEQLRALGYTSQFERSMSVWENFALGFTYLSPVVGVYSVFAFGLATGGPAMLWSYFIAGMGQMLVCLIFGEIVSQFPISGGVYPWGRRLVGKRWAWMVGWIYAWALFTTLAAVSTGAGPFLASLLGFEPGRNVTTLVALGLVTVSTLLNLMGTKLLARVAMFGFICELVGAFVVGTYLLFFKRHYPISVVFDTFGIGGTGSYLPAFLAASLVGLFTCYGFEACGDVAEETPNPGTAIPKAMRMTIYVGVGASIFVCLALILAMPDIPAVISGVDKDPLHTVLTNAFGPVASKGVIAVVLVSFVSAMLSLQAAVSRLIFAYARDKMIVGSDFLNHLSPNTHVPVRALVVAGIVPAAIACLGFFVQDALTTIVNFAVAGIYIAFQMIVLGALIARVRGWRPNGQFTMRTWGWIVNVGALLYGIGAILNIVWPRALSPQWYLNYSMLLTVAFVIGTGLLYMTLLRPYDHGDAPAGDAWLLAGSKRHASRKKVTVA